ncbi:MAG: spore cortex biosynthesis protein YabQ [Oscillospiraceae bacterium]|nr:spore cortex biosynthesis protein YabQ [Oscillospiraceae bacterium]
MQLETFFSVSQHTSLFLMSIVFGAAVGVFYDCFRALRIIFPPAAKDAAVLVEDILFCIVSGFALFCFSTLAVRGQIRFFVILGAVVGFVLYLMTIGSFVTWLLKIVFGTIYGSLRKVYSWIIEPIVNLSRNICQKESCVFVGSTENVENKGLSGENHLKNEADLVYNEKAKLGSSMLK